VNEDYCLSLWTHGWSRFFLSGKVPFWKAMGHLTIKLKTYSDHPAIRQSLLTTILKLRRYNHEYFTLFTKPHANPRFALCCVNLQDISHSWWRADTHARSPGSVLGQYHRNVAALHLIRPRKHCRSLSIPLLKLIGR